MKTWRVNFVQYGEEHTTTVQADTRYEAKQAVERMGPGTYVYSVYEVQRP